MARDNPIPAGGYQWLNAHQARTLLAAIARVFPEDDSGPGAVQIGVATYIDRALGGHDADSRPAYRRGLEALDEDAAARVGRLFADCDPDAQDAILRDIEVRERAAAPAPLARPFFQTLLTHTREGLFSDPIYGGNRAMAGWRLLGFPGIQLSYGARDVAHDVAIRTRRLYSLEDWGRALKPGWMTDRTATRADPVFGRGAPARSTGLRPQGVDARAPVPDVCIVGMGAAGSTAAYALGNAGMRVVVLEAGHAIDSRDSRPDELYAAYARGGHSPKFNQELQTWRPNATAAATTAHYSLGKMANGVGGATQIYGTWMRRYQHHDFAIRSGTIARYGETALPAGSALADWPISYGDLEPYYSRVERVMGIAGIGGNLRGEPVPGGNPFEPYRSEPLPLPPTRRAPTGELFSEAARRLGYHPYPVPVSVNSEPYDGRPACTYCSWCTFYVCHNDSKSTAGNTFARKALALRTVELRTHCRVVAINADEDGTVTSVDYVDPEGLVVRQRARVFIVAGYTFENVRLLLLSRSPAFPNGLGNNRGQVGKYFMTKMYQTVLGLFPGKRLNRFVGAGHQGTIMDDFVGDNFDHAGLGFIRGATISCEEQIHPIGASRMPLPPGVPAWGAAYKRHVVRHWNSIADMRIQPETLPYEDTFLDLDPRVRDTSGLGLPVVRITWDIHENERLMMGHLEGKVREILREMGASGDGGIWAGPRFTGAGSAHDLGGCRMGAAPASSVVEASLRVHDSPNLYVMGGAVFPSGGGINPTLTIQALTWRACDELAREWGRGRGA